MVSLSFFLVFTQFSLWQYSMSDNNNKTRKILVFLFNVTKPRAESNHTKSSVPNLGIWGPTHPEFWYTSTIRTIDSKTNSLALIAIERIVTRIKTDHFCISWNESGDGVRMFWEKLTILSSKTQTKVCTYCI